MAVLTQGLPLTPLRLPVHCRKTWLSPPVESEADGWRQEFQPDVSPAAMTVAIVCESQIRAGVAAVATRLATLAVTDELVVVCGSDEHPPERGVHALVVGLRERLPRYNVVTLYGGTLGSDAALLDDVLEVGGLPVVLTPATAARDLALELADRLGADRILAVSYRPANGVILRQVSHYNTGARSN